jgi:hypothetical protein
MEFLSSSSAVGLNFAIGCNKLCKKNQGIFHESTLIIDKRNMCMFITFINNRVLPESASANKKHHVQNLWEKFVYERNRFNCKSPKKRYWTLKDLEFDPQQTNIKCSSFKCFTLPPSMHQLNMEGIISKPPTPSQNSCQVRTPLYTQFLVQKEILILLDRQVGIPSRCFGMARNSLAKG